LWKKKVKVYAIYIYIYIIYIYYIYIYVYIHTTHIYIYIYVHIYIYNIYVIYICILHLLSPFYSTKVPICIHLYIDLPSYSTLSTTTVHRLLACMEYKGARECVVQQVPGEVHLLAPSYSTQMSNCINLSIDLPAYSTRFTTTVYSLQWGGYE